MEEPWVHAVHLQQCEQEVAWHQEPPAKPEYWIVMVAVSFSKIQPCSRLHPASCKHQNYLQDPGPVVLVDCEYLPFSLVVSVASWVHLHLAPQQLQALDEPLTVEFGDVN